MEFTADNLEKAVTMFYRSEAAGQQQAEAHKWLTEAQNSPQAWGFVWELLNTQRTSEVQFFAATTLHTKILKHWNEVPVDCYEELKKKILATIVNYATGPKLVLNRLCITLSAYIIHTIPTYWPKAFEELVSSFQPHHLPNVEPERVIWILLEILTVIPEEFQSVTLALSHKNKVRAVLQDVSKDILRVIQMCLMPIPAAGFSMTNLTTYLNAARCASTWVQLGGLNIDDVALLLELLIDLICYIYWNRGDDHGCGGSSNSGFAHSIIANAINAEDVMVGMAEASLLNCDEMEVIEYAVEAISAIFQHPNTCKYRQHIIKYTANLLYKFEKILDVERNSCELNKEIVTNLYNIIINIADNHAKIFIQNLKSSELDEQKLSFDLLNSILKCSNLPGIYPIDESSSILTFGFWYTLQDEVLNLDAAECAQLLITIKPYYRNLVCIMLNKSMYPITDDEWSLDDQEVFRCYRQDIADTYTYSYNVLNLEMLDILQCKLTDALTAIDTISKAQLPPPPAQQQQQVLWNEIETCLHAYGAVAESIEMENEHVYLPKFFITLKTIPFADLHIKVLASALEAIGSYSEWFTDHPSMIEHVLPLIVHALNNPEVATSATLALKDVAQSCHKYLIPYADHILLSCKNVLESGLLKLAESRRLMFSIGKLLSVLPLPRIMEYLNILLAPSFDELNELINSPDPQSAGVVNSLVTRLKLLSSLFNSLYVEDIAKNYPLQQQQQQLVLEQPVLTILKNTMHLYKVIAEKYSHNLDVTDDLSILLKNSVATLKEDCKPLINDILHIVLTLYKEYPQCQVLVVAKTILILFGKDEECLLLNTHLLYELTTVTIQWCIQLNAAANNANAAGSSKCTSSLSEKSDVIEAYFEMMAQMIKKVPHLLFNTNNNIDHEMLFQCATMCLVLNEVQTVKSISNYLVHFITHSREVSQASAVVQTHGETLVMRILMSLGATAPRTCAEPLGDILFILNKKYCDNLSRWLNSLLVAQNGFPSPRITTQQKSNFIKCILREKANKRKVSEYVLEFMLICKGIIKIDPSL